MSATRTPHRTPRSTLWPQGSQNNLPPLSPEVKSPGKISAGHHHFDNARDGGTRTILGGWRILKEAIKQGHFHHGLWKSGNNLAADGAHSGREGLWSEKQKTTPAKVQIGVEKEHVDKLFGMHVGIWFVIGEPFAKGGFGEVRYGYHKSMSAKKFAVKIETVNHSGLRHLSTEYNIYSILGDAPGIPRCYYYGLCGIMHNALVMDLLGPSLDDVFEAMKRRFSLRTVVMIALQAFERLQYLHSRGVVHGDVKGENFLIGLPNEGLDKVIYIVDFGLSQVLKDPSKGVFLYSENTPTFPAGTPRYMSISAHNGNALSFRDDLESLAYVLVYFMKGRLPWQGIQEKDTSKKSAIIKQRKTEETPEIICTLLPEEFAQFLHYARTLRFQEEPDYEYLKVLFRGLLERTDNVSDQLGFDWVGKTFSFRKEPKRHPILPRAEFQKKISVPSIMPNDKLKIMNAHRTSALQLTVKSARTQVRPRTSRTVMVHPNSARIDSLSMSSSVTSLEKIKEPALQAATNLKVPHSGKSAHALAKESPRIRRNSKDITSQSSEGHQMAAMKMRSARSRKDAQTLASPNSMNALAMESLPMSENGTETHLKRKLESENLPDNIIRPSEEVRSNLLLVSTGTSNASGAWSTRTQQFMPVPPLNLTADSPGNFPRSPSARNQTYAEAKKEEQSAGEDHDAPGSQAADNVFQETLLDSSPEMPSTSPEKTKPSKHAKIVLPRKGLKAPLHSGRKAHTAQPSPVPSASAQQTQTFDKTLHRINVYDVKIDGDGTTVNSLVKAGGCFTWIRRRTICGGGSRSGSDLKNKVKTG